MLKEVERLFWGKPVGITSKSGKPITSGGSYVFKNLDNIDNISKLLFVISEMDESFNEPFDNYNYLAGIYYGDDVDKIIKKGKEKIDGRLTKYNHWLWLEKWIDEGIKKGELNVQKAEIEDEFDMDLSTVYEYNVTISVDDKLYWCDYVNVLKELYE